MNYTAFTAFLPLRPRGWGRPSVTQGRGVRCASSRRLLQTKTTASNWQCTSTIPDALPDVIVQKLEEDLQVGRVLSVAEVTVGPGQQNKHFRYDTSRGAYLAKVNYTGTESVFAAEMKSLRALSSVGLLRVPFPLAYGKLPLGGSYLLLEFVHLVPFGASIPSVQAALGEALAKTHLYSVSPTGRFGFEMDTYLGGGLQVNGWMDDWATFFRERRLRPQLERAWTKYGSSAYGTSNENATAIRHLGTRLLKNDGEVIRELFRDVDVRPVLIHGDLFMGNCGADSGRRPVVFDPACSYAHSEMDLALNTMFGSFGSDFTKAYHQIIPRAPGFQRRQELYRLYYYLNHLNLHGAGYGHDGTTENPNGYYERCVELLTSLCARKE